MEPLTDRERTQILADLQKAQEYIDNINNGKRYNHHIAKPHQYMGATISTREEPLQSKRGELMYYTKIRDTLKGLLEKGVAKSSEPFIRAPEFIRKRLQSPEPATSDSQ